MSLLGALWLAGCGASSDSGRDWPEPSPALWEVTSPDGNRGWLFGTIHALPDGVAWRTPGFDEALGRSSVLLVEVLQSDLDDAQSVFDRLGTSPDLPPLLQRFEPDERADVTVLLDRAGVSDTSFRHSETWAAALILSASARTGDTANGVDRALLAERPEVLALESAQAQLSIFDRLPEEEQEDLLLAVAREAAAQRADASVKAWLTGDEEAFVALAQDSLLADPELRAALLDARNLAWIERIVAAVDAGDRPFVAVGASHMIGPSGLPALLSARGYRVRRIQ